MSFDIHNIHLPKYEEFVRRPRAPECKIIDTKRIIAEILGGEHDARQEFQDSKYSDEQLLAGASIVLKYRREKDGETYPAITMSYDIDEAGNIIIRQIQRAQNKKISFRFNSSFDAPKYFIKLIEENFTKQGIKVFMPIPEGLDGAGFRSTAIQEFEDIQKKLETLNASIDT